MPQPPTLIEGIARLIRHDGVSLSEAMAEAVTQTRALCATGKVYGERSLAPEDHRRRACLAIAEWESMRRRPAASRQLQEAFDLTARWTRMERREWLVAFALEERDFSAERRRKLARSGHALPDGSYPIENVSDLKNAIQAIGRAGASKRARVKAHIIKMARRLKALSALPDDWQVQESGSAWDEATRLLAEMFLPGGGGGGETTLDGSSDPDEGDEFIPAGTGTTGSPHPGVAAAQRKLSAAGFDTGDDGPGEFGAGTISAVQRFQGAKGLRVHGHLDGPTLEALDRNSSPTFVVN